MPQEILRYKGGGKELAFVSNSCLFYFIANSSSSLPNEYGTFHLLIFCINVVNIIGAEVSVCQTF